MAIYKLKCSFDRDTGISKAYTYAYEGDVVPKIGDQVLINSVHYDGYAIAWVREATETTAEDVVGWTMVVQFLSLEPIRQEKERAIKLEVLRKQLAKLREKRAAELELAELASMSPEAAKLVADFQAIGGVK